jgi:pyrroline-5-carboxylate reductase
MKEITIIGGGHLGGALAKGLLTRGGVSKTELTVVERAIDGRNKLAAELGVNVLEKISPEIAKSQVIVVAVKPQDVSQVLRELRTLITKENIVVSVAAGLSLQSLRSLIEDRSLVVRAMPNLPATIGAGITGIYSEDLAAGDLGEEIFSVLGETVRVSSDGELDGVLALAASGVGFVALLLEAWISGGVKVGLSREVSEKLALHTFIGAAKTIVNNNESPELFRQRVMTPGGTTIAGLHVLEKHGVRGAIMDAIIAAAERSAEIGKEIK